MDESRRELIQTLTVFMDGHLEMFEAARILVYRDEFVDMTVEKVVGIAQVCPGSLCHESMLKRGKKVFGGGGMHL